MFFFEFWGDSVRESTFMVNFSTFESLTWLEASGKLNTANVLQSKGIHQSTRCSLCGIYDESHTHLFLHCAFSILIWKEVWKDLQIQCLPDEVGDLWSSWRKQWEVPQSVRLEMGHMYAMTIIWLLWHERNTRIFHQKFKTNKAILAFVNYSVNLLAGELPQKKWRIFGGRQGAKGLQDTKLCKQDRHKHWKLKLLNKVV